MVDCQNLAQVALDIGNYKSNCIIFMTLNVTDVNYFRRYLKTLNRVFARPVGCYNRP